MKVENEQIWMFVYGLIRNCIYLYSEYIEESGLVVDYNQHGDIVGLEIIPFSKKVGKNEELAAMAI